MIIPHEIVSNNHYYNSWELNYYSSHISHEHILLYIIAQLHIQGKINDKRRNGMFDSLRNGRLIRKVKTYHCPITNRWYNDEGTFGIICEAFNEVCVRKDLTIEQFLPYINLYTNKNRNFCLNFIFYQYIKPLLRNLGNDDCVKLLRKFNLKDLEQTMTTYEEADRNGDLSSGYCCDDCDGCYSQYKKSRYEYNYKRHSSKDAAALFIKHLNNLKVGRWQLNPLQLTYTD